MTEQSMPMLTDSEREMLMRVTHILEDYPDNDPRIIHLMQVARAALAAKPVGLTDSGELRGLNSESNFVAHVMPTDYQGVDKGDEVWLYTAPPVPVLKLPDEFPNMSGHSPEHIHGFNMGLGWYEESVKRLNGVTK